MNYNDLGGGLAAAAGAGIVVLLIIIAIGVGVIVLGVWLTYTLIWRAVRRGLREYFDNPADLKRR